MSSLAQVGVFRMLFDVGLCEGAQRVDLQALAASDIEHAADQRRADAAPSSALGTSVWSIVSTPSARL